MSSDFDLAALVQLGQDITSTKIYVVCVTTLWVYDYLLTFADEVRYAWKVERVLIFVLFLISRYLPAVFQTWVIITQHYPNYVTEGQTCQKTAYFQVVYVTIITVTAQLVLIQRAYAITGKNRWIAATLYAIFLLQLAVGIYITVWAATGPIAEFPPIPLDGYRMCLTRTARYLTVLQMSVSLAFDVVVFALVAFQTNRIRSRYQGMSNSNILSKVSRDAETYFGVIATSHFIIVVMFAVARPGIGPIPIVGNAVYLPMMISRMIISLKKVASSQRTHMNLEAPNANLTGPQDSYTPHRIENIQLSTFKD